MHIVSGVRVERAPQFVEHCTVCDTYERYTGKPYWGHQNGCHPVGLKQVPVEVELYDMIDTIQYLMFIIIIIIIFV